jgi:glutathione S-transferase
MTDFIVYGTPMSPFVRKVEVVLREKGLPYDFEAVNIMAKPDWFLEISPMGRIPVLRDRRMGNEGVNGTIPDSSAICAFLEADTPVPGLYPKDPYTLGRALWFEEYADSEMAATIGFNLFRPILFPRLQGKPSDLETARRTWREKLPRMFDYIESQLDGRTWLAGEVMTIADIALACQMTNLDLVAGLPDAGRWPSLVAHTRRMATRPTFRANLDLCAALLEKSLGSKVDLN